jgi:ABC-type enterochelin transport system substrate-binding protein
MIFLHKHTLQYKACIEAKRKYIIISKRVSRNLDNAIKICPKICVQREINSIFKSGDFFNLEKLIAKQLI